MARQISPRMRILFWVITLCVLGVGSLVWFALSFQSGLGASNVIPPPSGTEPIFLRPGLPGGPPENSGTAPRSAATPRVPPRPMPEPMRRQLYADLRRAEAMAADATKRAFPQQPNEPKAAASRRAAIQRQFDARLQQSLYSRLATSGFMVPNFATIRAEGIAKKWPLPAVPSSAPASPAAAPPSAKSP